MAVAKRLSALVESRAKARQGGDDGDFARREPVGLYVQLTSEQRKRVLAFDQPVGSGLISLPKARMSGGTSQATRGLKAQFPTELIASAHSS